MFLDSKHHFSPYMCITKLLDSEGRVLGNFRISWPLIGQSKNPTNQNRAFRMKLTEIRGKKVSKAHFTAIPTHFIPYIHVEISESYSLFFTANFVKI